MSEEQLLSLLLSEASGRSMDLTGRCGASGITGVLSLLTDPGLGDGASMATKLSEATRRNIAAFGSGMWRPLATDGFSPDTMSVFVSKLMLHFHTMSHCVKQSETCDRERSDTAAHNVATPTATSQHHFGV